ncbi:MAG: phosphatase PAP2 family protein [Clostridia bacterium]|nr:phosphatase PAP2 family protein [Clostridia bacterium]
MDFLRFLAEFRTPFLDNFFQIVTRFGEETLFIVIGLIFFWCINKREGYYLLLVGFIGIIFNQFLKIVFRVPRPWVKDPNFKFVGNSNIEATGYSFPSGHTQSSVGVFGGIARWNKNKIIRIVCILILALVSFSRLYLGVHTPLDVIVSILIASALIFIIYPIINKITKNDNSLRILIIISAALSAALLLFLNLFKFPENINQENLNSAIENGYKMLGCILGIWLSFEIDTRFTHFETKAPIWFQALKLVFGVIPIFLIKELLKQPLLNLFDGNLFADCIRYFLMASVAACLWPMIFSYASKKLYKKD